MGWHERYASVYDRGSRGTLRPEALNLTAWNHMLTDFTTTTTTKNTLKRYIDIYIYISFLLVSFCLIIIITLFHLLKMIAYAIFSKT
jgi:lipopolysaccharide/colanic/teichoic acid biosynthesis glycosyltransferase